MRTILIILICTKLPFLVFSQNPQGLTFGGSNNDNGYALSKTDDGGFILAGTTRSYGEGSEDIYLIRINATGQVIWSETFGGAHQDFARSVITTNNGYFVTGDVWDGGNGRMGLYLCKIDNDGNKVWDKQYGTIMDEFGFKVLETNDGDILLLGYSRGYDLHGDNFLVKTNLNANLLDFHELICGI